MYNQKCCDLLSIIVCSVNSELRKQLASNIDATIGDCPFELIVINNKIENLSITNAYNLGASKSNYPNLLFILEDILFKTDYWCVILLHELSSKNIGIVGVAGSTYVPFAPCGYTNPVKDYNFYHIIQHTSNGEKFFIKLPEDKYSMKGLDGVLLGIKRDVFNEFQFDGSLQGFHGYDLDISLRVSCYYKNKIIDSILIEHLSQGKPNERYIRNNIVIREKISIENKYNDTLNEYSSYRQFVASLFRNDFEISEIKFLSKKFRNPKRLGMINYLKSYYFTLRLFKENIK